MLHGIARVLAHIVGAGEQIRTVAQRRHVEGISGKLFLAHDVDRQVGKVFAFQRDIADIPCVGIALCVIPGFRYHRFRERVLAVKEHLQSVLYLGQRPFPLMPCADDGQQHIGIVFYFIEVKMVFVVAVDAGVGIQIVLQLGLHAGIGGLGPQQVSVLGGIGGRPHSPRRAVA